MGYFKCSVLSSLGQVLKGLSTLTKKVQSMSEAIDTLLARVTEIETVGDSIIAVLASVRADLALAIANNDMSAVSDVNTRLENQAAEIAAAITAGTVAEGEEPPVV